MKTADVAKELEAVLLRQMLSEAKAFGGAGAGSHVYGDFFVDALADAVAKGGGLGLATMLEKSLGGPADALPASPASPALAAMHAQHAAHVQHTVHAGRSTHATLSESSASLGPLPVLQDAVRPPASLEELVVGGSARVSSRFGPRADPIHGRASFHQGVDIAAPNGSPIHVARDGVVSFAGDRGGYGLVVEVDHGDGLVTRYAHASRLHVQAGDKVSAGDRVADVGSTGRSTGAHVHVEAFERGKRVDPSLALQNGEIRVDR